MGDNSVVHVITFDDRLIRHIIKADSRVRVKLQLNKWAGWILVVVSKKDIPAHFY